jgi:hypothetical protein
MCHRIRCVLLTINGAYLTVRVCFHTVCLSFAARSSHKSSLLRPFVALYIAENTMERRYTMKRRMLLAGFVTVPLPRVSLAAALVQFQTEGKMALNPKLLRDDWLATDRIWTSGHQHSVQHRHADGSFGLLGCKATGAQPGSDQCLVSTHCRFY